MKKVFFLILAAECLLLSGCASLLERSYTVVEPYTDRYWDTEAEDTLRAETYPDLVNTLLLLLEQRAEEGVIRYYGEGSAYSVAGAAVREIRKETVLGAYLLENMVFTCQSEKEYSTLNYTITYREGAEDPTGMLLLSDSQSLADLLRLALREGHSSVTARFAADISRQEVTEAVEAFWKAQWLEQLPPPEPEEDAETPSQPEETSAAEPPQGSLLQTAESDAPSAEPSAAPSDESSSDPSVLTDGEASAEAAPPEEELPAEENIPPCPWVTLFYPDRDPVDLVEILLTIP